jgi:hypothetical protein
MNSSSVTATAVEDEDEFECGKKSNPTSPTSSLVPTTFNNLTTDYQQMAAYQQAMEIEKAKLVFNEKDLEFRRIEMNQAMAIEDKRIVAMKEVEQMRITAAKELEEMKIAAAKDSEDKRIAAARELEEMKIVAAKDAAVKIIAADKDLQEKQIAAAKDLENKKIAAAKDLKDKDIKAAEEVEEKRKMLTIAVTDSTNLKFVEKLSQEKQLEEKRLELEQRKVNIALRAEQRHDYINKNSKNDNNNNTKKKNKRKRGGSDEEEEEEEVSSYVHELEKIKKKHFNMFGTVYEAPPPV